MRSKIGGLIAALISITCSVLPCAAQTGTVSFYSIDLSVKRQIKTAVTPVGEVAFTGWVFDGDKKMAHAVRGRFMSFQLPTGPHEFWVPYKSSGPPKKPCTPMDCLHLNIESGNRYCVRLSAKDVNAIVIPFMVLDSRIEQVSCDRAVQEAGGYKRIDPKRVDPSIQAQLDDSPYFTK